MCTNASESGIRMTHVHEAITATVATRRIALAVRKENVRVRAVGRRRLRGHGSGRSVASPPHGCEVRVVHTAGEAQVRELRAEVRRVFAVGAPLPVRLVIPVAPSYMRIRAHGLRRLTARARMGAGAAHVRTADGDTKARCAQT